MFQKYCYKIDKKNRISLPKKLQEYFNEKVFFNRGFDNDNFILRNKDQMETFENWLNNLQDTKQANRIIKRHFAINNFLQEIDKNNRLTIPKFICEELKIDKEVVFLFVGKHIELWNPLVLEKQTNNSQINIKELLENID
ncbi:hypothetical protein JTY60_01390 [symbiont of Argiope bruennichi]|uniref:hypothetical protein n=1 Tax=symbiont of Argiope bruennichi TaxID=2810479 RepID=UPI003DA6B790